MLIIDNELAKKVIAEGINKGTTLAKMKDGKTIDLYFRKLENKPYIIAGMNLDNENETYYIVAKEDIGTIIFLHTELNQVLDEGIEKMNKVVQLLKKAKNLK